MNELLACVALDPSQTGMPLSTCHICSAAYRDCAEKILQRDISSLDFNAWIMRGKKTFEA